MDYGLQLGRPFFVWLVVLIPLYIMSHFYFLRRNQGKAMRFANFEALKRISGNRLLTRNLPLLFIRLIILAAMILVITQTTMTYVGERNDFDYVILLDTSSSMTSTDVLPTRLAAAKDAAITFIDTLKTDAQVGLVTFAGVTYVRSPLTDEKTSLRLKIATTNISRISGTDISGAIISGANLFQDDARGKAIILITDGVDTVGGYLDENIKEAARYMQKENIVIHAVGLGTKGGAIGYLPVDFNLTSSVDKNSLSYLANQTGGTAVFPETSNELSNYFETFNERSHEGIIALPLDRYALMVAFVLLLVEWLAYNLFFRRIA